ncbi:NF-kappa-B inhibitor-interacting Ras-like protein [Aphelenchoides besseyi]|nr:NF-kappa-B inhibitor-interacting Ras-like protein [Aphelenchoides besseyi]KAI6217913.1 NF-kappa-B inhibitor-interacting Ras-like protein [Aphelenchoides besseyi]
MTTNGKQLDRNRGFSVKALRIRNAASRRLSVNPNSSYATNFNPDRRFSRKDIPVDSRAKHDFDSATDSDGERQSSTYFQDSNTLDGVVRRKNRILSHQPNSFAGPPSSPRHVAASSLRRTSAAVLMRKVMRIVVLGPKKSGKTSLLLQSVLADNVLQRPYIPTIEDTYQLSTNADSSGPREILIFHDTAGFQRCPPELARPIVQVADAFMLVYSVNNAEHFEIVTQLKKCIEKAFNKDKRDIPIVLVGTMIDLPGRQVDIEKATAYANKENVKLFELAASDRASLVEVVHYIAGRHFHPIKESKFSLSRRLKPANAQILMEL